MFVLGWWFDELSRRMPRDVPGRDPDLHHSCSQLFMASVDETGLLWDFV